MDLTKSTEKLAPIQPNVNASMFVLTAEQPIPNEATMVVPNLQEFDSKAPATIKAKYLIYSRLAGLQLKFL